MLKINLPGSVILLIFLTIQLCTGVSAAELSDDLRAILHHSQADEIPVIVTFRSAEKPVPLAKRLGPRQRREIVDQLQRQSSSGLAPLNRLLQRHRINNLNLRPLWLINGAAFSAPAEVVRQIASLPHVAAITLDERIQLPQTLDNPTALPQWNIDRTRAPMLWNLGYTGTEVTVAILDSGLNIDHPDLAARWRGRPGDWFDPYGNSPRPYDFGNYHGTAVAGVIAGEDFGGTAIGMAPGARLIAAKLFRDDGSANTSYIIQALQWVLNPGGNPDNAPQIINISWGFEDSSGECLDTIGFGRSALLLRDAVRVVRSSGIAVVAAAGNSGPGTASSTSPANYPESFAVGATSDSDFIAGFSSRGPSACPGDTTFPDIVAPGVMIKTAGQSSQFQYLSGTSFAAPHVSGAMALLLQAKPTLSVAELESFITSAAVDLGPSGPDDSYGYGLLDVVQALFLIDKNLLIKQPLMILSGSFPDPMDPTREIIDFGLINTTDELQRTVQIRNNGNGNLHIDPITDVPSSPFHLEPSDCSQTILTPGESCFLTLHFAPLLPAVYSDQLTIQSNDSQRPELRILLSGTADQLFPRLEVTPTAIAFGQVAPGNSANRTLVLSNTGTAPVEQLRIDLSSLTAPFSSVSNSCESVLPPQGQCGVTIRFSPNEVGVHQGQIVVYSSDPEAQTTPIIVSGTGNTPPTRPRPLTPSDGSVFSTTDQITLTWIAAVDADGDEVVHSLVLADNPGFLNPIEADGFRATVMILTTIGLGMAGIRHKRNTPVVAVLMIMLLWLNSCGGGGGNRGVNESGNPTSTDFELSQTIDSLSPGTYYWKVYADDGRGGISQSDTVSFKVE